MLASGHTINPVEDKEQQEQEENFNGYKNSRLQRLTPGNWLFSNEFLPYLDKIYNFKLRPTDVVILTYPKCGTTWMTEIIWTMFNNANLDNPMAKRGVGSLCHFLDLDALSSMGNHKPTTSNEQLVQRFRKLCPGKDPKDGIFLQMAEAGRDPRTIITHIPLSMMPSSLLDTCKVIYVARNPKDVCVSYLHHSRLMKAIGYVGNTDKFVDNFVNENLIYSPYGLHLKEAWDKREHKNMHFVFFEDMKANPKKAIQEIDHFLATKLSEEQIDNVVEHTSFAAMKARDNLMSGVKSDNMVESVLKNDGSMFRKGETGSFKEKINEEQERKIEKWTKENAAEIPFKYK